MTTLSRRNFVALSSAAALTGCRARPADPATVVSIIESSPTNLDPRVGTDAQSERIGGLLFDPLVRKDAAFRMTPWLALAWQQPPNSSDWIFCLRDGVRFHDGRPLEAADAAWTINSMASGSLLTAKSGAFASVLRAEAPDRLTLRLRMAQPDASLFFNLSDGPFGVVPRGSGRELGQAPIGSGPFRFVSAAQDSHVLLARNPAYWAGPPSIPRVRFAVIPDAVTSALELRKGSADIASNILTLDMVHTLEQDPALVTRAAQGSRVFYLNFNCANGPLAAPAVRQAVASAMDRAEIVRTLWRSRAQLAPTLLPPGHWAAASPADLTAWPHSSARAAALLQSAGYAPDSRGVRLRLEMKTSTDDLTRLVALVLQQQLRAAGIELALRPAEFGTFYADVTSGRFQMYALNWVGSNQDPDIFRYAYGSDRTPPRGGNRGHYANPHLDRLLAAASATYDEPTRRALYLQVQQILSSDVPTVPLWYPDNLIVHSRRVAGIVPPPDGSYSFLRTATLS